MTNSEALELIIHEGTAEDGMDVMTRGGEDPGRERVERLKTALALVEQSIRGEPMINRALAEALYCLSFHMSDRVFAWLHCEWIDVYDEVLELIEAIFEGWRPPPGGWAK